MTRNKAIATVIILTVISLIIPSFVIIRSINVENGWKGLPWGASESQTREWIDKNNNKAVWSKCNLPHYGVSCFKVTWKDTKQTPFEFIEFQFKNGKLCAVIESNHEEPSDPADALHLNRPGVERLTGQDLAYDFYRDRSYRYKLVDRVFYYVEPRNWKDTRVRYAVARLVRINLSDLTEPDIVMDYQLSTAYYSLDYFEETKDHLENFPSHRFNLKK